MAGVKFEAHYQLFQFTPLREGRPARFPRFPFGLRYFNSRPSARGDAYKVRATQDAINFNSRPSARGDQIMDYTEDAEHISIHAPPRGATSSERQTTSGLHFNSRPSARGDRIPVDTHSIEKDFNSRPSARGDAAKLFQFFRDAQFQFTPLREGRHGVISWMKLASYFNSRPSARGDRARGKRVGGIRISIHAPPRGATFTAFVGDTGISFQFTPLREGRPWHPHGAAGNAEISIHAPPRGATEIES